MFNIIYKTKEEMRIQMEVVYVKSKKDQKIYFSLFNKVYKDNKHAAYTYWETRT
jgi:hypothetical protein